MAELGFPGLLQPRLRLHRRMAGAGRRPVACARRGRPARVRRGGAPRFLESAFRFRTGLALVGLLAGLFFVGAAHAQVLSSRIWPARDYTRLTIESKDELKYSLFGVKD